MKGKIEVLMIVCILMTAFFAAIAIGPAAVRAATLYVGGTGVGNYTTVQSAIDAATVGGTVYVFKGTYYENVQISKTLSLIGQSVDDVIVNGRQQGDVITASVTANWVNITGFTVMGTGGVYSGIVLGSANCHVYGNKLTNITYGITVHGTGHVIENNTLSNNEYSGMRVIGFNNIIKDNKLSRSGEGIHFFDSKANVVTGNLMTETGIYVEGSALDEWNTHTIDTTNTVNGRPVYYWSNANGGTIPPDAGQVILAGSKNVRVENLNTSGGAVGIELGFSSNSVIANSNVSNNVEGIFLAYSDQNLIANNSLFSNSHSGIYWRSSYGDTASGNTISDSPFGIIIHVTTNLTISDNEMFRNGLLIDGWAISQWQSHEIDASNTVNGAPVCFWKDVRGGSVPPGAGQVILVNSTGVIARGLHIEKASVGMQLGFSSGNIVTNSTFSSNYYGIEMEESKNNTFYHNNFIDNEMQISHAWCNTWDNGYPEGGNYWSNYFGSDKKSGPNQNESGSDGIGDTPYSDPTPYDRYPLMHPFGSPSSPRNLQAIPGLGQVVLSWEVPASDGGFLITNYTVYRGLMSGDEKPLVTLGDVLNYTDTNVVSGHQYYYTVSATNSVGEGMQSAETSATPTSSTLPTIVASILDETWFWVLVIFLIVAVIAVLAVVLRKRKRNAAIAEEPSRSEEMS